ncbi:MAG TPA: hypothetical protein VFA89_22520 [Terriglobales bacterium]|nr:hypothetical protein [Terriglobales bacterium]
MKSFRSGLSCTAALFAIAAGFGLVARETAHGELHWQSPKKQELRVRLIALALAPPRSSFFPNQEVFVAALEVTKDESRLIKLVYEFLPYQPPLSDYGMDYSLLHEIRAERDPSCDETLKDMSYPRYVPEWPRADQSWKYSLDSPELNPERRHARLPCYQTTAQDYDRSVHQPPSEEDRP